MPAEEIWLKKFDEYKKIQTSKYGHIDRDTNVDHPKWNYGVNDEIMDRLKKRARDDLGLWNLFLPKHNHNSKSDSESSSSESSDNVIPSSLLSPLTNLEYAYCAELMGRSWLASEVTNCSAPDSGNMEVLYKYGNSEQQKKWLIPLLKGEIRSCFFMTEPNKVKGSSDASNIECSIERREEEGIYIVNGRKWWSSGACDKRCKVGILMGKVINKDSSKFNNSKNSQHQHQQQTMLICPLSTPGIKIIRSLHVFNYDDSPHGHAEVSFINVRLSIKDSLLLNKEGQGFEIAQGRLGPGRVHHCMRALGLAERTMEAMMQRGKERIAFGKQLIGHQVNRFKLAESRIQLEMARLLVLKCAAKIDESQNSQNSQNSNQQQHELSLPKLEIAMIKVQIPRLVCKILDQAIQLYGGEGVCQDQFLAFASAQARVLRIVDGPEDVHLETIGRIELKEHEKRRKKLLMLGDEKSGNPVVKGVAGYAAKSRSKL